RIEFALWSSKLSAQSPPCNRKASPEATRASAFFRLRASPAKTSGGKLASRASTASSLAASGYCGTWTIGFPRQLSGVQRSGMIQLLACRNGLPCRAGRFIHERIARENALKAHKHEENRFRESVVRMERPPKADAQSGARMPVPDFAMARRRRGER